MTPSRKGHERQQSGKQWLEFLALESGINTVQLKDAMHRTNRTAGDGVAMTTGAIKGQFTEERQPSNEFQALVRLTLSDLIARGRLGNWREDVHSYRAFCDNAPIIKAPMRFDRQHLESVTAYIGSFALIRSTFDRRVEVDYLSVLAPLPNGAYPIDWWLKELVEDRSTYLLHRGFAYLSNRQFSIEVARALNDRDARIVKLSVSRNDNDHTNRLVAVKLGCCAIDGAPHARCVYMMKLADRPMDEPTWRRVVEAIEADIAANGPGEMDFPEAHASNNGIRDIPDRLAKLVADCIGRASNDGGGIEPKVATRARRKRA